MKTSEIKWTFPVLGFTPDGDVWGFNDLEALTTCGPQTLAQDMQADMELIEADGRRWIVRGIRRLGRGRPNWRWLLLSGLSISRIDHDLEPLEARLLPEVLEQVCACMDAHAEFWCEDDERETVLPRRKSEVRAVASLKGVHEVLGLDNFRDY